MSNSVAWKMVTGYSLENEDKRRAVDRAQIVAWPPEQWALLPDPPYPIFGKASEIRSKGSTLCERQFPAAIYDPFRVMILLAMR